MELTGEELAYIIANRKRKTHLRVGKFIFTLMFTFVFTCATSIVFNDYVNENIDPNGALTPSDQLLLDFLFGIVGIPLGVTFLSLTVVRFRQTLRFINIVTPFSKEENFKIALQVCRQKECQVSEHAEYIIANVEAEFGSKQDITIIPLSQGLLINSRPGPYEKSPVTIYRDVKNIKWFREQVAGYVSGELKL